MSDKKYVYSFGAGQADGSASMKNELGGKGANLAEMNLIGLPVPAGFTLSTEVCTYFYDNNHTYPPELASQVEAGLKNVEEVMGAKFGDAENPLLLSCRSGARESMPGMMDTVLNIGLNETTVNALINQSGNEHFAWDSYRRLIQMYGDVVLELKPQKKTDPDFFEDILEKELPRRRRRPREGPVGRSDQRHRPTVQGGHQGAGERRLPGRPDGAAVGLHRRRLRKLDERPGDGLSAAVRYPPRMGDGDQRPGHGVRQPRRRLRDRRRPHPKLLRRNARVLRRLPHQCPGRRRRRRHANAEARRGVAQGRRTGRVRAAQQHRQDAGTALQGRAGTSSSPSRRARSGCCRPATPSGPDSPPCESPSTW